jgi:hypothetical protein
MIVKKEYPIRQVTDMKFQYLNLVFISVEVVKIHFALLL